MDHNTARRYINESMQRGSASILQHAIEMDRYELTEVVRSAQQGDHAARQQCSLAVCRYAQKVAKHYYMLWLPKLPHSFHYDDCFAAALEGIACSIDSFEVDGVNSFTGYCSERIRWKVQRCIYRSMGIVRIPESQLSSLDLKHPMLGTSGLSYEGASPKDDAGRTIEETNTDERHGDGIAQLEAREAVEALLQALGSIDARLPMLAQRLSEGDCKRQCSIDLGIPTKAIDELLDKAANVLEYTDYVN